ncbi:MAG TPA: MraY family glycosyltransferase [Planctomycetia bacterium]|nr:MraY family glycosyltransferase [Planctomycetia bacterium]
MVWFWIAAFTVPAALCAALTRAAIAAAPRVGLIDRPAARKLHLAPMPMGGGVAIYLTVMAAMLGAVAGAWLTLKVPALGALIPESLAKYVPGVLSKASELGWIALAGTVQMLLGLVDDRRPGGLDYKLRLAVEVGLVAWLVYLGIGLKLDPLPSWVSGAVTVVWVVGLTNAVNFLDNMDGLAAGVSFLAAAFFAAVMALVGSLFVAGCFLVVAGALLGFLRYNWNPARIFMGDAGSNFLGFWLGMLTVVGTFVVAPFNPVTVFAPLCILAVPIYDSASVIALRLAQGRSPFQPDKQHFSHRLVQLGLTHRKAVLLIYLVTITTGLGGVLLYFLTPARAGSVAPLVVLQVTCMLGVVGLLEAAAHGRFGAQGEPRVPLPIPTDAKGPEPGQG